DARAYRSRRLHALELLVGELPVELAEERARRRERSPRRELRRSPLAAPLLVGAGEDGVRLALVLDDLTELERSGERVLVPEQLVQRLRAERQERREQRLQAVHAAQRDEEDRGRPLAVGVEEGPRRVLAQVRVHVARQRHRLAERGAEARGLDQRAHAVER